MNAGYKVQYKSLLSGKWVDSHLDGFATERKAANAAARDLPQYETRVVSAGAAA